jgi:hypothetical protein
MQKNLNMNILLANKQTDEEKKSNNITRFYFITSMMNLDIVGIKNLLKSEVKFMGWMNEWQFCNWLDKNFKSLGAPRAFHARYKELICMDTCPGADMFLFEYVIMDRNFNYDFFSDMNEEDMDPFNNDNVLRIGLALIFENGKISSIRPSKKGLELTNLKKSQVEN